MNTMNSTSMTSTKGVTLISLSGRYRRLAPRLPRRPLAGIRVAAMRSALLVQLARHDRAELAGEGLQPSGVAPEVVRQLVVADHRRNRGDQAERGGEQRLGDARRPPRMAGVRERTAPNAPGKASSLPAEGLRAFDSLCEPSTAGIGATRPRAVANSALAMPGATTARLVFFAAAIEVKAFMMPHTVPNRPMKGAAEPTEARKVMWRSRRSISRPSAISITRSMRCCRPYFTSIEAAMPRAAERRHSRIAETKIDDIGSGCRLSRRS